jgi:hypothetical protein
VALNHRFPGPNPGRAATKITIPLYYGFVSKIEGFCFFKKTMQIANKREKTLKKDSFVLI